MKLLSVDPGPQFSAYSILDTHKSPPKIFQFQKIENNSLLSLLKQRAALGTERLVVEQIKNFGMAMGDSTINTVLWSGRFVQIYENDFDLIPRKTICSIICQNPRAKDTNIRQAIIDRFGGKEKAIGNKKNPGPLHGVSGDVWSAIAIGIAYDELLREKDREELMEIL
jgi:hypothetical protein